MPDHHRGGFIAGERDRQHAAQSNNTVLKELYANTLLGLKRYHEVLRVFEDLPV
jgi:hypothetical protein